jgi:O-methyltransferase domain/Dimerisation domain
MNTDDKRSGTAPPPHAQLMQMSMGHIAQRLLYAAAQLNLAEHLARAPCSAEELAGTLKLHAPSLHRLLRTLAQLGIFTESEPGRFALTDLGQALRADAPGSVRATILLFGSEWSCAGWDNLLYSLETGKSGVQKAFGTDLFAYLAERPAAATVFNDAMVAFHGGEPPAVAAAYDFSIYRTLIDIGGGTGNLLSTVLARHAGVRGVLFDQPQVLAQARPLFSERGVEGRISFEPGNFFDSVPAGGDAYMLSHIIHDWNEEQCLTILGNCRRAMKPGSRLLIVEMVLPEGDTPHPGKISDMIMLVITGGRERSSEEYRALLAKAGLRLTRVVPTASAVSVVEAESA